MSQTASLRRTPAEHRRGPGRHASPGSMVRRRRPLVRLLASSLALAGACGGNGGQDDGGQDGGLTDGRVECVGPLAFCEGECVDPRVDPSHCGGCNHRCGGGLVCVGGECVPRCPSPTVLCGEACVDPRSDPSHCGGCHIECEEDAVCSEGGCRSSCDEGLTDCARSCVDLRTDPSHCGRCGRACEVEERCVDGVCETEPVELTECNGARVDLRTDPSHCGRCDRRCGPDVPCTGGACSVDCVPSASSLVADPVIRRDATAIHSIVVDGVNLIEANGGYYVIGTCTGADDENHNVISRGSDGATLHAPGSCPGAPFSIAYSGTNPLRVSITVGPLPVDYKGLSVPFDPHRDYFTDFGFSGSGYSVGCADGWSSRSGSGGPFTSIPQPCVIPGHGSVGLARVTGAPDGMWAEIRGPHATVRRVIISSNLSEVFFVRHPYTHNVELSWGTEPLSRSLLPAGSVYSLEEELHILDPAASAVSSSRLVSYDVPSSAAGGDTVPASVTMCNDGSLSWIEPSDGVGGTRLGALASNALEWVPGPSGGYSNGLDDQRIFLGAPVAPGTVVTFELGLRPPVSPGSYALGARMVQDGVAWFGPEVRAEVRASP